MLILKTLDIGKTFFLLKSTRTDMYSNQVTATVKNFENFNYGA